jgi:hypothetical protein
MPSVSKNSMLKAVAIVGVTSAAVLAVQTYLWQAKANSRQGMSAASMSSFILDLHSSDYAKNLPVHTVEDPI